jgi:hypothetical protein
VRLVGPPIRSPDGTEERTFGDCFVQILGPGEKVEVQNESIPLEMHNGMEHENRAEQFVYWAQFLDSRLRR